MSTCKACGEDIRFIQTPSGKWMPVNGLEEETYYLHLGDQGEPRMVLITPDGQVIRGRIGRATDNGVTLARGYEAHWATCTHPDQFRRKP